MSHQLPYANSVHHSSSPLELIFSDVWGPAPCSIGGYKYYISFIDDFSKFSWIYLMHDRSEAPGVTPQCHLGFLSNAKPRTIISCESK
jgi:hypothetical protein